MEKYNLTSANSPAKVNYQQQRTASFQKQAVFERIVVNVSYIQWSSCKKNLGIRKKVKFGMGDHW